MKRTLIVCYATVAYAWFLLDVAWGIAFLAGVSTLTRVDQATSAGTPAALAIDLALLAAFAVPHSIMARASVKRVITRVVPPAAERATYVLVADVLLALVFWQWRSIDGTLWHVAAQPWRDLLWVAYGLGWVIAVAATFMIDHLDFVGLRQAATPAARYVPAPFQVRWLYAWVRHPLMLGLLIAFWATPTMSTGHLLFATTFTAYIAVGTYFEERDLRRSLGEPYRDYARRTAAIVPIPRRTESSRRAVSAER